ncbi:MAG: hypothetical protein DWQ36_22650 [Acidobacteria bacterium]|nr:MAG: hypothetical protein DWQ36_22650 [Acidobacteriota bacterium]
MSGGRLAGVTGTSIWVWRGPGGSAFVAAGLAGALGRRFRDGSGPVDSGGDGLPAMAASGSSSASDRRRTEKRPAPLFSTMRAGGRAPPTSSRAPPSIS